MQCNALPCSPLSYLLPHSPLTRSAQSHRLSKLGSIKHTQLLSKQKGKPFTACGGRSLDCCAVVQCQVHVFTVIQALLRGHTVGTRGCRCRRSTQKACGTTEQTVRSASFSFLPSGEYAREKGLGYGTRISTSPPPCRAASEDMSRANHPLAPFTPLSLSISRSLRHRFSRTTLRRARAMPRAHTWFA